MPKRLRTQPGTPKPLSGRRRARRGAEGPGARKKRRHPSRFRTMQQQNSISGSKRTARQIKETDRPIRFFWFCFLLIFAAIFAFLMRFFICFLCVFYVFFVLYPPLAGLSLLFLYGTLHISAHISAYQVCPAAAALRIRGADPFLRIFRFPQYSL
ncbi:MAG: hypothetical protein L6V89_06440 [Oscillospiraceae bacterium]|nr:MAG: hypothetical protein L6V89_06440 [Oscillospiraceae bacterium]